MPHKDVLARLGLLRSRYKNNCNDMLSSILGPVYTSRNFGEGSLGRGSLGSTQV